MAVIKIVPMPGAVGDKGDEGAPGAQGLQGEQGLQGPAGADALWSYNGEWQLNSSYATGDVVTYQGQLYYTKAITTAGTLPTDTSKFDLIAAKGADGEPGLNGLEGDQGPQGEPGADGSPGLVYLGDYVSGNGYIANIAVVKGADENLYIAKSSGGLLSPVANPGQWDLFLPKGANGADGATPFTLIGAYDNGAAYNLGIAVYYNGGTYVRTGNPLNPGYPPEVGAINASWTPIAEKGDAGSQLNYWNFAGDPGVPTVDGLLVVDGISGRSETGQGNVSIFAGPTASVVLAGNGGEFLKDTNIPENQIATIGDLPTQTSGFLSPDETLSVDNLGIQIKVDPLNSGSYSIHVASLVGSDIYYFTNTQILFTPEGSSPNTKRGTLNTTTTYQKVVNYYLNPVAAPGASQVVTLADPVNEKLYRVTFASTNSITKFPVVIEKLIG